MADALQLSSDQFKQQYGFDQPTRDDHIVYYCRSGVRAENAAMMSEAMGWRNVHNYRGSFQDWFGHTYPI